METTKLILNQPYTFLFNSFQNTTGATCGIKIIRISTQTEYLDNAMTEVSSSDAPGLYKYVWTPTVTDYYAVYKYDGSYSNPNTVSIEAVDVASAPSYKYFLYTAMFNQTGLIPLLRLVNTATDAIVLLDVGMTETNAAVCPGLYQYQWTAPTTGTWAAYKFTGTFADPYGMEEELIYISTTTDVFVNEMTISNVAGSVNTVGRWISQVSRV